MTEEVEDMRGREIPGCWPDPVPILSRSWPLPRQIPEFGLVGPPTRPHVDDEQVGVTSRRIRRSSGSSARAARIW